MIMKLIENAKQLLTVPEELKEEFESDKRIWTRVEIPIELYFKLSMTDNYSFKHYPPNKNQVIDPNDKCNRTDRNDLLKKQGILKCIFAGMPIPDLSLVIKNKRRSILDVKQQVASVNDGGHRSRTIIEFKANQIKTSPDTVFYTENNTEIKIGDMTYDEIKKKFPNAVKKFDGYLLCLTLQWNLDSKQRKMDFDCRNTQNKIERQEGRNANDDNRVADGVRNAVNKIFGEIDARPVHNVFTKDVLGFKNDKMVYDEIVAKIMKMNHEYEEHGGHTDLTNDSLDEFYLKGSYAGTDNGIFYKNTKQFKKLLDNTYKVLDFLEGVLTEWPQKIYAKKQLVVHALLRWYFQYKKDLQNENLSLEYNGTFRIDYKKFATQFAKVVMLENTNNEETGKWTGKEKLPRVFGEAFTGFLGHFKNDIKMQLSVKWIMNSFYDSLKTLEDEEKFGLTHFDSRPSFNTKDIIQKWMDNGEKDCLKNEPVSSDDIQGDHAIPRSHGVVAGGVTEKSNLKILHKDDNNKKSDRTFEEYKKVINE